jgi:hypothetical protein
MSQFRKKPVVIQAVQWFPYTPEHLQESWFLDACLNGEVCPELDGTLTIRTLEDGADGRARHVASPGDWIIQGIQGELYPCKPDIFEATYEPVESQDLNRWCSDCAQHVTTSCRGDERSCVFNWAHVRNTPTETK